jgi:hypothetical protein
MSNITTTRVYPWRIAEGYADSHCRKCQLGWTRENQKGEVLIKCLLDVEPPPTELANCDRFDPDPKKA